MVAPMHSRRIQETEKETTIQHSFHLVQTTEIIGWSESQNPSRKLVCLSKKCLREVLWEFHFESLHIETWDAPNDLFIVTGEMQLIQATGIFLL